MACSKRGMALVSVLLLLTVLLALAHILAEKVWQSTRQVAEAASRAQLFWAAQAGIEAARRQLAVGYASSGGWRDFLARGDGRNYPLEPAWVSVIDGLQVEIYLRDNPDGDGDVRSDNDLKIYVLARAQSAQEGEALIECLCGFDPPTASGGLPQFGPGPYGTGLTGRPISRYGISD
jgi:type II secretory pathway pseudopilin PulG